ncbi:MAG: DsrE family protein, partial [Bacteroidota bacterium]
MKEIFIFCLFFVSTCAFAQERVAPLIKNYGAIYDIAEASVKPDPSLKYKIVVDAKTGGDADQLAFALNNVARMLNLHVIGGVQPENLEVVVAIHGGATKAIMKNEAYQKRYETDNPNIELIKELAEAGVKLVVCGQSLTGRK